MLCKVLGIILWCTECMAFKLSLLYFEKSIIFLSRPHDTPFEDGTFKLTIEFTEEYPNKPPTVRFVSKMFHPNVYADGGICLDILQNRWSPTYDVSAILTSIQVSLLAWEFSISCMARASIMICKLLFAFSRVFFFNASTAVAIHPKVGTSRVKFMIHDIRLLNLVN